MEQMTICQETVEICEYYRLNPYQMTSAWRGSDGDVTKRSSCYICWKRRACEPQAWDDPRTEIARVITSGEEVRYAGSYRTARWNWRAGMAEHVTDR